jgi:hypothetical protein
MFYDFLALSGKTINDFDYELWMKHFRKNARYRTVCQECNSLIESLHKHKLKKERYESALPKDD